MIANGAPYSVARDGTTLRTAHFSGLEVVIHAILSAGRTTPQVQVNVARLYLSCDSVGVGLVCIRSKRKCSVRQHSLWSSSSKLFTQASLRPSLRVSCLLMTLVVAYIGLSRANQQSGV